MKLKGTRLEISIDNDEAMIRNYKRLKTNLDMVRADFHKAYHIITYVLLIKFLTLIGATGDVIDPLQLDVRRKSVRVANNRRGFFQEDCLSLPPFVVCSITYATNSGITMNKKG